jgi:hypothetical protein
MSRKEWVEDGQVLATAVLITAGYYADEIARILKVSRATAYRLKDEAVAQKLCEFTPHTRPTRLQSVLDPREYDKYKYMIGILARFPPVMRQIMTNIRRDVAAVAAVEAGAATPGSDAAADDRSDDLESKNIDGYIKRNNWLNSADPGSFLVKIDRKIAVITEKIASLREIVHKACERFGDPVLPDAMRERLLDLGINPADKPDRKS